MKKNSEPGKAHANGPVTGLKFEDALKRLEEITTSLENGNVGLEEMLKLYQEGMQLLQFCEKKLEEAQQKINILIKEGEGRFTAKEFGGAGSNESENGEKDKESSGGLF